MKTINIYCRTAVLTDVCGRIDYATNPERQEHLLAVAGETDPAFWEQLAKESQQAWWTAGGKRKQKCREAREIHGALSNNALDCDLQELAQKIADAFTEKYGAPCIVAIHLNKEENNLHYHLIFCDREILPEPEIRIAEKRAAFLDEHGVRKQTKKEIMDEEGNLRAGCRIVPKGEIISERHFGARERAFNEKGWLADYKQWMADWINEELQPDKKRVVFDPRGPYLPQHKLKNGISDEKAAEIRKYNQTVRNYNDAVESGSVSLEDAAIVKDLVMLAPDRAEAMAYLFNPKSVRSSMPGGVRTKYNPTDPVEQKKQQLRELYRDSRIAWTEAKKYEKGSAEWKIAVAKARGISAQIEEARRYLGMYTYEEYMDILDKEEAERRRHRAAVMRYRSQGYNYYQKQKGCDKRISKLYGELLWVPILFPTEEDKALRKKILGEIREMEELKEWYAQQEVEAYRREAEAKRKAREQRKKGRELRQEARQQKKKEKVQERTQGR